MTYAITVDIQLAERPLHAAHVYQHTHTHHGHGNASTQVALTDSTAQTYGIAASGSGNSSERDQDAEEDADFKKYNVRDVAYADKVNLKIAEAIPPLEQHLASSFANLFD